MKDLSGRELVIDSRVSSPSVSPPRERLARQAGDFAGRGQATHRKVSAARAGPKPRRSKAQAVTPRPARSPRPTGAAPARSMGLAPTWPTYTRSPALDSSQELLAGGERRGLTGSSSATPASPRTVWPTRHEEVPAFFPSAATAAAAATKVDGSRPSSTRDRGRPEGGPGRRRAVRALATHESHTIAAMTSPWRGVIWAPAGAARRREYYAGITPATSGHARRPPRRVADDTRAREDRLYARDQARPERRPKRSGPGRSRPTRDDAKIAARIPRRAWTGRSVPGPSPIQSPSSRRSSPRGLQEGVPCASGYAWKPARGERPDLIPEAHADDRGKAGLLDSITSPMMEQAPNRKPTTRWPRR